ncbi:DUF3592 domain-containing protein [Nocardia sp. NPDC127526]|uniref:DUF3592 domain-containing protein n=1 Tax=Nocardia sp. NPDC127526 TaxID=3345393 RepID=UPI0036258E65
MKRNSLFALGVGVVIVLLGVGLGVWNNSQLAGKTRTDGTVVVSGDRDGEGGVVRFTAADGREYLADITSWSVLHQYWRGDIVAVAYDPDDPNDARVADFHETYSGTVFIGGFGGLIILAGVCGLFAARRRRRLTAWLADHGRELHVPVRSVRVKEGARGSKSDKILSYSLEASCVDPVTGQPFTAKSEAFEQHPGPYLAARDHVRVLYDPADPRRNQLL